MRKMWSSILALVFLSALLAAAPPIPGQQASSVPDQGILKDVRVVKHASGVEVVIMFSSNASYKSFELSSPPRLVVDIIGVHKVTASPEIEVGEAGVRRVRAALYAKDMGRVVFDVIDKMPRYTILKIADGLRVVFGTDVPPALKEEAKPAGVKPAKADAAPGAADKRQKEETQKILEETIKLYDKSLQEGQGAMEKTRRAMAFGALFFPGGGGHNARYGQGLKIGAELASSIADNFEIWVSASLLSESAIDAGQDFSASLFPLLGGLNYRFKAGKIQPYVGVGAGYFFYSETTAAGTNREHEFGIAAQAGAFMRLGRSFLLGAKMQYDHCRIGSKARRIDPGGFHIGFMAGADF